MENSEKIDWPKIDEIVEKYNGNREALLMIMQDVSDMYNYVPPEVVPFLVEKLGVRKSLVYSVATFYKTISLEPRGKYIVNVCTGTACHVRGADKIMDAAKFTDVGYCSSCIFGSVKIRLGIDDRHDSRCFCFMMVFSQDVVCDRYYYWCPDYHTA